MVINACGNPAVIAPAEGWSASGGRAESAKQSPERNDMQTHDKFNAVFGIPAANIAFRLFAANAFALPPEEPQTLEDLNKAVDRIMGEASALGAVQQYDAALDRISAAIKAVDEWEKSHRNAAVYDSLNADALMKFADLFILRATLTEKLGQDYELAVADLGNAVEIHDELGLAFAKAIVLEEIGDVKRRHGIESGLDYYKAAQEYNGLYNSYRNCEYLPVEILTALGLNERDQKGLITVRFRTMMKMRASAAAQKGGDLVAAINALEDARKDLAASIESPEEASSGVRIEEDRKLESEIEYLEKVQDGTISAVNGLRPLLPADFYETYDSVEKTVNHFRGLDIEAVERRAVTFDAWTMERGYPIGHGGRESWLFSAQRIINHFKELAPKVDGRWAAALDAWKMEIDRSIEQGQRLARYFRDRRLDVGDGQKIADVVAELNGFGGRVAIAAGDFRNVGKYYERAAAIYLPTCQYIKGADLSVQYAESLANKGQSTEAQTFFMTAGEYYELAGNASKTPSERMLALELAGDMYRRGGRDLQAKQVYGEAIVIQAKPGEDGGNLPEYRRGRIVEKLIAIEEELVLRAVRADLVSLYPDFNRLSAADQQKTAERCRDDWRRDPSAFGNVPRDFVSRWLENAKRAGAEADTVRGVRTDRDRDRRDGERPAEESRGGAAEGRPGGIGK